MTKRARSVTVVVKEVVPARMFRTVIVMVHRVRVHVEKATTTATATARLPQVILAGTYVTMFTT